MADKDNVAGFVDGIVRNIEHLRFNGPFEKHDFVAAVVTSLAYQYQLPARSWSPSDLREELDQQEVGLTERERDRVIAYAMQSDEFSWLNNYANDDQEGIARAVAEGIRRFKESI